MAGKKTKKPVWFDWKYFIDSGYNLIEIHVMLNNRSAKKLPTWMHILTPIATKTVLITVILGKHLKMLTVPGLSMIQLASNACAKEL